MPTIDKFGTELRWQLRVADANGASFVEISSTELFRQTISGARAPRTPEQMSICRAAMYDEMRPGDLRLSASKGGKTTSIKVRYMLPRR